MMDWLAQHGPSLALVMFMAVFIGFALWVCWPGQKAKFQSYANIPFKESGEGGE